MAVSGHRTRAIFDHCNIVSEADLAAAADRTLAHVAARRREEPHVVPLETVRRARVNGEHGH